MEKEKTIVSIGMVLLVAGFALFMLHFGSALNPDGPYDTTIGTESEKPNLSADEVNTSGGTITPLTISAVVQNPRWKAFVGNVSGTYVLSDAGNNRIYDWNIASVTGKIYALRKATTPVWASVACATSGQVSTENTQMSQSNINDNISRTFNRSSHPQFWVGAVNISANNCSYVLNTYVDNSSQTTEFYEVLLHDQSGVTGMIYTTILEQDEDAYNQGTYDFQMIVPERGTKGFTGSTAYYLYVELGN